MWFGGESDSLLHPVLMFFSPDSNSAGVVFRFLCACGLGGCAALPPLGQFPPPPPVAWFLNLKQNRRICKKYVDQI